MSAAQYDLVVIGCGSAEQKGGHLRKRVAVIDHTLMIGGVCVHTGTIPSKSLREAIVDRFCSEGFYGTNDRGNVCVAGS